MPNELVCCFEKYAKNRTMETAEKAEAGERTEEEDEEEDEKAPTFGLYNL